MIIGIFYVDNRRIFGENLCYVNFKILLNKNLLIYKKLYRAVSTAKFHCLAHVIFYENDNVTIV